MQNYDSGYSSLCLDSCWSKRIGSGKRCEYLPIASEQGRLLDFRDRALAKVRDIEELVDVGKSLNTCPYYGTRKAIKPAQVRMHEVRKGLQFRWVLTYNSSARHPSISAPSTQNHTRVSRYIAQKQYCHHRWSTQSHRYHQFHSYNNYSFEANENCIVTAFPILTTIQIKTLGQEYRLYQTNNHGCQSNDKVSGRRCSA